MITGANRTVCSGTGFPHASKTYSNIWKERVHVYPILTRISGFPNSGLPALLDIAFVREITVLEKAAQYDSSYAGEIHASCD